MTKLSAMTSMLVLTLNFAMVTPPAKSAQDPAGFQAAEPIRRDQQFAVTFHRPNLKGSQVVWVNNSDIVDAGPALLQKEIEQGFEVGDLIVIRMKAPLDCFVYGVNNSEWDGATLVENGETLRAGVERDFVYKLTNRQGKQGVGNENILFLIRRQQIPQEEVAKFLQTPAFNKTQPATGSQQHKPENAAAPTNRLQLGGTPTEQKSAAQSLQQEEKRAGKLGAILKVSCGVASIFFPFVGNICKATGFAAAEPVQRGQLQPETDAQNIVIQFSFPVRV